MVVIGEFLDPPEQVDAITPLGKNEAAELSRNGSTLTLVSQRAM